MFIPVQAGVYVQTPILNSVGQVAGDTAFGATIRGKPNTRFTVSMEKEDSVGAGTFTEIGTAILNLGAAGVITTYPTQSPFSLPSLSVAGATFPGTTGWKYRVRIVAPVVSAYSNEFTTITTYVADPTGTAIGISINGPRDEITVTYTGTGSLQTSSYCVQGYVYNSTPTVVGSFNNTGAGVISYPSGVPAGGYVRADACYVNETGGFWVLDSGMRNFP
jgi:hypothetical protein